MQGKMVMKFETIVTESIQRTKSIISVRFSKPEGFEYLPGQYIFIAIGSGDGELKKPLSISCSPTEGFLEVTKRLTGHPFSNALSTLKEGDKIWFKGPLGDFTFLGGHEKIGMLSGGIGITPLRSIIKYISDKKLETDAVLFYSNSYEDDIAFEKEFEDLERMSPKLKVVSTVTRPGPSWTGITGRITAEMIKAHSPDYMDRVFYISGPPRMVDSSLNMLKEMNIPKAQIKKESFVGYD
jgi:ferredoxin-NADP reductase